MTTNRSISVADLERAMEQPDTREAVRRVLADGQWWLLVDLERIVGKTRPTLFYAIQQGVRCGYFATRRVLVGRYWHTCVRLVSQTKYDKALSESEQPPR